MSDSGSHIPLVPRRRAADRHPAVRPTAPVLLSEVYLLGARMTALALGMIAVLIVDFFLMLVIWLSLAKGEGILRTMPMGAVFAAATVALIAHLVAVWLFARTYLRAGVATLYAIRDQEGTNAP